MLSAKTIFPGDPRQRRGLPAVLLHRRQRRGPGRLGERPDRRASARVAARTWRPRSPGTAPTRTSTAGSSHALLRKRGLRAGARCPPTPTTPCCWSASASASPTPGCRRDEPLTEQDILAYLAHSRVTEQRASEQMRAAAQALRRPPGHRPRGPDDLRRRGQPPRLLPRGAAAAGLAPGTAAPSSASCARAHCAEIAVYRDVSLAVMAHMGASWAGPRPKAAVLAAGIHAVYRVRTARRLAADGVPADAGPAQRPRRPAAEAAGAGAVGVTPTRSREPTARPGLPPCPGCSGRR